MSAEPEQWAVELWHRFHRSYLMEYCESHQQGVQSAALTIQRAFEERTGQLIPAPSVDDAMVERVAISLAEFDCANWDAQSFNDTPAGETPEEMRRGYRAKAIAAISAMQVKP